MVNTPISNDNTGTQGKLLEAKFRLAKMNGYTGPKTNPSIDSFAKASPAMAAKFNAMGVALAKGGLIKGYADGGLEDGITSGSGSEANWWTYGGRNYTTLGEAQAAQAAAGEITEGTTEEDTTPTKEDTTPTEEDTTEEGVAEPDVLGDAFQNLFSQTSEPVKADVAKVALTPEQLISEAAGQAPTQATSVGVAKAGEAKLAEDVAPTAPATFEAVTIAPEVAAEAAKLQPVQGQVSEQAQVQAEQQTTSAVSDLEAAQGVATLMDNPVQREIQDGELVSGVANAEKAAAYIEQIQAAQATPSKQATVQGQLEGLMTQFEGGETPAWAAGAMRAAMGTLAARGLGASSLAGQAVVQAAMEAALPIAQMDAQTIAQFESQNLTNRQQTAMFAAQQRAQFLGMEFDQAFQARVANAAKVSDVANMNFTAEQQIALENSRIINTMNLQNLSNEQAMVLAEASALSQLDMANLNNRQQAAVQNAQNFMQMDLTNLANEQQTAMFKSQQVIQSLFTDQAAENAALQFNAASQNQTDQFFANLASQTSKFNASQQNAMAQFNTNAENAVNQFNAQMQDQRDQFNAQNSLVVAQANAKWRQDLDTINTAAQNEANADYAKAINSLTETNLNNIWQRERDIMSYAFSSAENALTREAELLMADKKADAIEDAGKTKVIASIADKAISWGL